MTPAVVGGQAGEASRDPGNAKLRSRDWILLPLLALLTIAVLVLGTESVAGHLFRAPTSTTLGCLVLNDPSTGVRGKPNSVCTQKSLESDATEYRFNSCGHRAGMECGPKQPGTFRIVLVGSSVNFGMWVPREKSFAALLPEELSQSIGRKVEVYNEAMQWGFPASTAIRFHEVFDQNPDLILWPLTPTDIANASQVMPFIPTMTPVDKAGSKARNLDRLKLTFSSLPTWNRLTSIWADPVLSAWNRQVESFRGSPSGVLLEHLLYANQSLYLKSYLMGKDSERGFLKAEPSAIWQKNLEDFDKDDAEIESQARAAGVPVVAVLLPDRAQAAMLSNGDWPAGYDPYKLNQQLRAIVLSHGGTYIDILPDYRTLVNPERHYFPADGHPDASGHAILARMLAKHLTDGDVPALRATAQVAQAQGK